ncbi:hypothetical protein ABIA32_005224 [Streptacidiphilus sp. MAP12-20]|uniref:hypothetical protein n=1 Tax=Streptacidiphilus sp. MAP12-20 TaxID=3156299 RepID=UPI0035145D5D
MRLAAAPPAETGTSDETRAKAQPKQRGGALASGGYAWHTPLPRVLLPTAAASGMVCSLGRALRTLAERARHLEGGGYGALMTAFGVGGLPGALLAAGASVVLTALAPAAVLAFVAMAPTGLASIWFIAWAVVHGVARLGAAHRLPVAAVLEHVAAWAGLSLSGVCLAPTALLSWRVLQDTSAGACVRACARARECRGNHGRGHRLEHRSPSHHAVGRSRGEVTLAHPSVRTTPR